mgnify:CR=1 FL=1
MSEVEEKKKKRIGWIVALTFNALLILLLFAFNMPGVEPPPPKPLIVLDFTAGSSSKGGSSAQTPTETQAKDPDPSPVDPVKTQDKSPVKRNDQKKGDNSSKSSTTETAQKANFSTIYCVLGANAEKIRNETTTKNIEFIFNKNFFLQPFFQCISPLFGYCFN